MYIQCTSVTDAYKDTINTMDITIIQMIVPNNNKSEPLNIYKDCFSIIQPNYMLIVITSYIHHLSRY